MFCPSIHSRTFPPRGCLWDPEEKLGPGGPFAFVAGTIGAFCTSQKQEPRQHTYVGMSHTTVRILRMYLYRGVRGIILFPGYVVEPLLMMAMPTMATEPPWEPASVVFRSPSGHGLVREWRPPCPRRPVLTCRRRFGRQNGRRLSLSSARISPRLAGNPPRGNRRATANLTLGDRHSLGGYRL